MSCRSMRTASTGSPTFRAFSNKPRRIREALIVGCPEYDATAPALRLWARYLTHLWVSINTLSRQIKDSMCGFRVYPLQALLDLDRRQKLGARMNFDIEVAGPAVLGRGRDHQSADAGHLS